MIVTVLSRIDDLLRRFRHSNFEALKIRNFDIKIFEILKLRTFETSKNQNYTIINIIVTVNIIAIVKIVISTHL
jgi:hypothetical protein